MTRTTLIFLMAFGLAGCMDGENPFDDLEEEEAAAEGEGSEGTPGDDEGIESDREVPPGTDEPTSDSGIVRSEPTSTENFGDGFATGIIYDSANDEFEVENLGFDGDNVYVRGGSADAVDPVGQLGGYAVYEASNQYPDDVTGDPINQLTHRAIYGVSPSGQTQFAIVRTGGYVEYGFGGFVYQRTGDVTLPTAGQALLTGRAAGIRDRSGNGGFEYSVADMSIAVDFDAFSTSYSGADAAAVRGFVGNRMVFDRDGNDITQDVLDRINADNQTGLTAIPNATFVIKPGALDENGEILGEMSSTYINSSGDAAEFESGKYYALLSGDFTSGDVDDPAEVVGVFVLEHTIDPIASKIRDTSGFILYRDD